MLSWSPENVRQIHQLSLTQAEKEKIHRKMPVAPDGNFYADAIFEGGGVRGTAFLGALRCFADAGIRLRKVAGTSAGSITAALVAAQISIDALEQIIGSLDYEKDLLKEKSNPLILNGSPEDDLANPVAMLTNLMLVGEKGQYSSEPFLAWLSQILKQHDLETFEPVIGRQRTAQGQKIPWYQQRQLKVVVSDISTGEMRILPQDLPKYKMSPAQFSVAEAVRLSMSIPMFFEPGQLGNSTIVDGGILSNFPLWIYDTPGRKMPNCPTFGLSLTEKKSSETKQIKSALDLFSSMMRTVMVARDRHYTRTNDHRRIINIDTSKVTTTQFNLDSDDKDYLYQQGYESTKRFLLDRWDWEQHLQARGYQPPARIVAQVPVSSSVSSNGSSPMASNDVDKGVSDRKVAISV